MSKETSLLLDVIVGRFPQEQVLRKGKHVDVIVGRFPQERVLRKGKHAVFQRTRCVSALPYFKNTLKPLNPSTSIEIGSWPSTIESVRP
jgi:hypothetical protein